MRNTKCDNCNQTFPLNETFKITENILCGNCAEQLINSQKDISREQIQRQFDPTVCVNCGKDNGDTELPNMAGLPTCEQCITYFRNRPYPAWIKAAMLGLAALVIFSFVWNWRFIHGYIDLRNSNAALTVGDINEAAKSLRSAASNVPETKSLSAAASFYEGLLLLTENKYAEALKALNSCRVYLPSGFPVDEMIFHAKAGIAFDNKDYDEFLDLALRAAEKDPRSYIYVASAASAYACKYAVTADEQFRQQSLDFLKKAEALSEQQGLLEQYLEYEDRIFHRLETRDIIENVEFRNRFPNGWKKQQKERSE